MKSSSTKGFWGSVGATHPKCGEEWGSYKGHTSTHTSENDHIRDAYIRIARHLRTLWRSIPTGTGGHRQGPKYIAVTLCVDENEYGLTDSSRTKGKRWACNTCFGFAPSVWSEGEAPDREEQEQEWADWAAKQSPQTDAGKRRDAFRKMGVL